MKLFYRNVLLTVVTVVSIGFLSACTTTSTSEKGDGGLKTETQGVKMAGGDWVLVHPSNPKALDANKDGIVTVAEKRAVIG
jgi:maltose-binding protein MalE